MPGPDVRYSRSLVQCFLTDFTREGDVVFDPFAGFGTTLQVAQDMGRQPYGLEINPARLEYARSFLKRPDQLIEGDAKRLASLPLPTFNFSMSSPPYMGEGDGEDPLTDYRAEGKGYQTYLNDLTAI